MIFIIKITFVVFKFDCSFGDYFMHHFLLVACCLTVLIFPLTCGAEDSPAIPSAHISVDHSYCRELAALAQKYGADRKLPASVTIDGSSCPAGEAAVCLLAVIDKVREKCAREGKDAVPREDIDRIGALHEALKGELARQEGYTTRREEIEKMLAKPETPEFVYKYGINGFLRGDVSNNLHLDGNSFNPGHTEGRFVYRVKPYVYWHPADWLDIHVEGQGYGFVGGGAQHFSEFSLYQGFVEAKLPGTDRLSLKGGRQEFVYGSAFILGADSFFDGLTFDAGRLRVKPTAALTLDLLGGVYATPFSGGVAGNLEGVYATYALAEGTAVEAYAFRDEIEHQWSNCLDIWGLRGTFRKGPLSLEFEPVYESGKRYGGHADLALETPVAGRTGRLFTSYAYGSGGRQTGFGISRAREFRNPNNDTSLVGDMHVITDLSGLTINDHHASGLQIYTLGWGIDLTKDLNFSATGHWFRANAADFGLSRDIGLETDFILTWKVAEGLSLIAGYDRFFTGSFFLDASAKRGLVVLPGSGLRFFSIPGSDRNIDYGYLMLQFDLSRSKPKMKLVKG